MVTDEKYKIGSPLFDILNNLTNRYPVLWSCSESIIEAFFILQNSFEKGNKLLVCGNGGSAADAEHFSGELLKGFLQKRPLPITLKTNLTSFIGNQDHWVDRLQGALPVLPLHTNTALISAVNNDIGADLVFAQQILGYGTRGDCLLAMSTSGNSENVIKAIIVAKGLGLHTIGLTGLSGGKIKELCEVTIRVPAEITYEVQELHLPIYHTLAAMLEEEFFKTGVD